MQFWFVENLGKIWKCWQNTENTDKNDAQRGENHMKTFFWGHPKNDCVLEELPTQRVARKVWGISSKNVFHPQKFACSNTCELFRTHSASRDASLFKFLFDE